MLAFGTQSFTIPAGSPLDQTCIFTVPTLFAGIHLFAASPQMRQLGTAIQSEQRVTAGGVSGSGAASMGELSPWTFGAQPWLPIDAILNSGDLVGTRCAWQNDTGSAVSFGQNMADEKCYSFTAYYPRITSSAWSWALPALESSCAPSADGGLPTPDAGWGATGGFGAYADGGVSDGAPP